MKSRLEEFNNNYINFFLLTKYNIKKSKQIPKISQLMLYLKLNNMDKKYYKIAFWIIFLFSMKRPSILRKHKKTNFFKVTLRKSEIFFILEKFINIILPNQGDLEKFTTNLVIKNYYSLRLKDCSNFLEMEKIYQIKNRFISNSKNLEFIVILKTKESKVNYVIANLRFLQIPFIIEN